MNKSRFLKKFWLQYHFLKTSTQRFCNYGKINIIVQSQISIIQGAMFNRKK